MTVIWDISAEVTHMFPIGRNSVGPCMFFPCESKRELLAAWTRRLKYQQFMLQLSLQLKHDGSKQHLTGSYTMLLLALWITEGNLSNMFISTWWFMSLCYFQINKVHSLLLGGDTQAEEGFIAQSHWWGSGRWRWAGTSRGKLSTCYYFTFYGNTARKSW